MEPIILQRSEHCISRQQISANALKVLYRLKDAGYKAYIAGGGVRDLLLGRVPKDFDIVTDAHPNQVKALFRNCRLIGRRFRLAHVFFHDDYIETATFRANLSAESAGQQEGAQFVAREGVILRDNVFGTPEEDAFRRDFTVNGLFYNIADFTVIDYVGGLKDLEARTLRVIGDPQVRFREDPVRMLRAIRLAASLEFTIEDQARRAISDMRGDLAHASRERLYEEMLKLCFCKRAAAAFDKLLRKGVFKTMCPAIGEWLDSPEGEEGHRWMARVLKQVDVWGKAGLKPSEPLLWALLFGAYHEAQACALIASGVHDHDAHTQTVSEHMLGAANLVQFPRQVTHGVSRIMTMQRQFTRTHGKQPKRLATREGFTDAFVYFKFSSNFKGAHADLVGWWDQYVDSRELR